MTTFHNDDGPRDRRASDGGSGGGGDAPGRDDAPAATTRVYRGRLTLARHSTSESESDPTFLRGLCTVHDDDCPNDDDDPLAGQLARAADQWGTNVTVRFVTGEDRKSADPKDPFGTGWAESRGRLDAAGALVEGTKPGKWTVTEHARVGSKDLLKALKAHAGRFVHLEVSYRP